MNITIIDDLKNILGFNLSFKARKHFPGHRGMAMPDRFWVKLKNQTNFELLSTGKKFITKNISNI